MSIGGTTIEGIVHLFDVWYIMMYMEEQGF